MNRCIAKPPKPQAPDFKAAATLAESTETSITCPFHTAWPRSGHSEDNFSRVCPDSAVCGSAGQHLERGKPYRVTSGESVYVAADHRATNPPRSPYIRK